MFRFLRNFELDQLSFWLGFLASTLLWWLIQRSRPALSRLRDRLREQAETGRMGALTVTEIRFKNDMLRRAQGLHLAAPLFALEELLIAPRVLAPPPPVEPGLAAPISDITEQVLPYLPDWTQLASIYEAPSFSLAEALSGGANLVLIGEPGSGKTVALAHLATEIARQSLEAGAFAGHVPFLLHVMDLELPAAEGVAPLETLVAALQPHVEKKTTARLPALTAAAFEQGRALLLLDGLDELHPERVEETVDFLEDLLDVYPRTRAVVVSGNTFDGLTRRLGFAPVALASWDYEQRAEFVQRWGTLWTRFVAQPVEADDQAIDPALINAWLISESPLLSPLELCLKTWAAYAGDALGADVSDALEAFVRRLTVTLPKSREAVQNLAVQMLQSRQPVVARAQAVRWVQDFDPAAFQTVDEAATEEETFASLDGSPENGDAHPSQPGSKEITAPRVLPGLLASGLLVRHPGERLTLIHGVITGYLAGQSLDGSQTPEILRQSDWVLKQVSLRFLDGGRPGAGLIEQLLSKDAGDPLRRNLFMTARWLGNPAGNPGWQAPVMRRLADTLQNDNLPVGLRARALAALVASGVPSVAVLFRQSFAAPDPHLRGLAALGSGALRDTQAVRELSNLLGDPAINVRRAACLALVSIGDKKALETVAAALLHGDEELRRAAAEALSNHPEEGHPTLEEGASIEDLLVRRAVVYGLLRVRKPWAHAALEKMQVEDSQWVVQNAASQALEVLDQPDPRIPRTMPPLTETPWLIEFASRQGIGVAPGKPARDLVLQAIQKGDEEHRLAGLEYMARFGDEDAVLPVYKAFFAERGDLQEAALNCLWHLAGSGIPLPHPEQFGL